MAKSRTAFDPDVTPAVTLAELEAATGLPREALMQRLNGTPTALNWAGQRCIPMIEARRLVEEIERDRREREEREAEREAAQRAWEAQREAAYRKAFEEALEAEARRVLQELARENVTYLGVTPPLGPGERARAAEVARQAVADWERKNTKPE
jgi:hypothetical protein